MSIVTKLFDQTFNGLQRAMDLTWRRNEALVSNIANAETPGYRAVDYSFGSELAQAFNQSTEAMSRTHTKHLDTSSSSGGRLVADLRGATKADGNNVDLELQMGQLTSNAGQYSIAADLYRKKLAQVKLAIREAGR
jgi:flagellar basal-body rod protein FlgB